jgi:outer membrane protein OmpA-like peptidoglycan-associated protein
LPGPVASLFNGHSGAVRTERRVYEERVAGPAIRRLERPRSAWGAWLLPLLVLAAALLAIPLVRAFRRPQVALPPHPQVMRTAAPPVPPAVETTPLPSSAKPRIGPAPSPAENAPAAAAPSAAENAPAAAAPSAAENAPEATETPPAAEANQPLRAAAPARVGDLAAFLNGAGEAPKTFAPKPLNFGFNSAELTPQSQGTLDKVASALTDHPSAKIRLESFTDDIGTPDSNMQLSTARSEAVKNELVQRGVPEDSIDTAGRGQEQPIATNDTAEGRAQNRRTEIVVTDR